MATTPIVLRPACGCEPGQRAEPELLAEPNNLITAEHYRVEQKTARLARAWWLTVANEGATYASKQLFAQSTLQNKEARPAGNY